MRSIIGYKNVIRNSKSQDYVDYKNVNNKLICAVADGHSTDFFEYSDEGARFACMASIDIIEKYIDRTQKEWEKLLSDKTIQKLIYEKWMSLVNEHYKENNPVVFKTEYIKYSTTLLSCCITDSFIISIKLGDGNIVIKEEEGYKKIINSKTEKVVHSLGRANAYENMKYTVSDINKLGENSNIILFTDGYENSFIEEAELFKSLDKTISKYKKSIFSRMWLCNKYEDYLNKLSKNISHDDISIIFIV
ncbi:protein phosphatase 2C domain-containing protein [Romboutsia sp.]|uniref:protein phosphatase 2C domain-containing protein n=1 Tax=Romboutsia sp. TaxID=1965302 RepID=UPI003F2C597D